MGESPESSRNFFHRMGEEQTTTNIHSSEMNSMQLYRPPSGTKVKSISQILPLNLQFNTPTAKKEGEAETGNNSPNQVSDKQPHFTVSEEDTARMEKKMDHFSERENKRSIAKPMRELTYAMKKREETGQVKPGKANDSNILKNYYNKKLMRQTRIKQYEEEENARHTKHRLEKIEEVVIDELEEDQELNKDNNLIKGQSMVKEKMIEAMDDPDIINIEPLKRQFTSIVESGNNTHKSLGRLQNSLEGLNEEQRMERAAQLFRDAYYSRPPRYSFTSDRIRSLYNLVGHPFWIGMMRWVAWFYLFLTFLEPGHSSEQTFNPFTLNYYRNMIIEFIFISFLWADLIIFTVVKYTDIEHTKKESFLNLKFITYVFCNFSLVIDFVCFYTCYAHDLPYFRFARLFRPWYLFCYSSGMVRDFKALLATWMHILDVFLLIIITIFLFALLAYKLFDTESDENITKESELRRLDWGIVNLYIMSSFSNYPAALIPYVESSTFYFLFFLPFILLILIFFIPIPVAKIFDNWEKNRTKLYLNDRLIEKEALFGIHFCIDIQGTGSFTDEQWLIFCHTVYGGKEEQDVVTEIFKLFDKDGNKSMDIYEFLDACEILLCIHNSTETSIIPELGCWKAIRKFCNKILKFDVWVTSTYFETFIMFVILVNLAVLITMTVKTDEETVDTCDQIDRYLLFIFLAECILKILTLGVYDYFKDGWNKFDFTLVVISLLMETALTFFRIAKFSKGAKFLKASRTAGSYENYLQPFSKNKGYDCCYSVLGIEIFHLESNHESQWANGKYGDFSSFGMGLIALFQILTQSGWHYVVLYYSEIFNIGGVFLFFFSFHAIQVIIFLNLSVGLIWEVFQVHAREQIAQAKQMEDEANEVLETKSCEEEKNKTATIKTETEKSEKGTHEDEHNKHSSKGFDITTMFGAKYYMRKALLNTNQNVKRLEEQENEYIKNEYGATRFAQAASRVITDIVEKKKLAETELELSHIEEDEIDHSKDHTRLLKTNSEHIFLIETSNFMKEIREKSSFEGLLLQLTHCFQFLNPLLGNDILLCHLLEQNWKAGQCLDTCITNSKKILYPPPKRLSFPNFLSQIVSLSSDSTPESTPMNRSKKSLFTTKWFNHKYNIKETPKPQNNSRNLLIQNVPVTEALNNFNKLSGFMKSRFIRILEERGTYTLIVQRVCIMEEKAEGRIDAQDRSSLDGAGIDSSRIVIKSPRAVSIGPKSMNILLLALIPHGANNLNKETKTMEDSQADIAEVEDFIMNVKDILHLHKGRLLDSIRNFAAKLPIPEYIIPYNSDGTIIKINPK